MENSGNGFAANECSNPHSMPMVAPKAVFELVTPERAQSILTHFNTHNRTLSRTTIDQYKRSLTAGTWELNGDPIRFDKNGFLLDGQHRLTAIVETGMSVDSLVVYNLDSKIKPTIDRGRKRSNADVYKMEGDEDAVYKAAIINSVAKRVHKLSSISFNESEVYRQKYAVGLNWILTKRSTLSATEIRRMSFMNRADIGGALVFVYKHNPRKVDEFYDSLRLGNNLTPDSPALALRDALLGFMKKESKKSYDNLFGYTLSMLHKHILGQTVKNISKAGEQVLKFFGLPA